MRVRPLPKSWLIHTVIYEGYTGKKDSLQNPAYELPVAIEFVRYDDSTIFIRDNTQTKVLADGVVYVDAVNSSPVPAFKERSRITFNGNYMFIKKIVPCYHPNRNEIHHYELEVV